MDVGAIISVSNCIHLWQEMHVFSVDSIKSTWVPSSFLFFLWTIFLVFSPGKMKMKMAANAPSICITTPMFGMKMASTRVMVNQTADTAILRAFSCARICSSVRPHTVFHRQSNAALKWRSFMLAGNFLFYFIFYTKFSFPFPFFHVIAKCIIFKYW